MALAAGLDSISVRIGGAFAAASVDARVRRLVAQRGDWAKVRFLCGAKFALFGLTAHSVKCEIVRRCCRVAVR